MRDFYRYIVILLLGMLAAQHAQGQRTAESAAVLRRWTAAQLRAESAVRQMTFEERTTREVDGPFGRRGTYLHARITGEPRSDSWRRDVLDAQANGRHLAPKEYERMESGGHHDERWLRAYLLGARLLARMQPTGPPLRERLNGTRALRFDVAPPPGNRVQIQRITVWFDQDGTRLLLTRAVVERPNRGGTFVVTTRYRRQGGLDLPVQRNVEGTMHTKRRLRTFTMLMRVDSAFSAYRLERP